MNDLTLGEKIRHFRKRAELSQLELETAISAAPGSVSRVESGKVNPTKETLYQLIPHLKLSHPEQLSLFGIGGQRITAGDIERVVAVLKPDFDLPTNIALLLDDHKNIVYASEGVYSLLPYPREQMSQLLGANLLLLIMDPKFRINQLIKNKEDLFPFEIMLFKQEMAGRETQDWYKELLSQLRLLPDFVRFEKQPIEMNQLFPPSARHISLSINGSEHTLVSGFRQLNLDPRFEIIEYVPIRA